MISRKRLAIGIVLGLLASVGRAEAPAGLEYQVKAAFLYNFAKFVEWPAGTFKGAGDSVIFCVLGNDPFGESLDDVVRGESLDGRRLVVHRTRDVSKAADCHVVFIARSERDRQETILGSLYRRGALTVGETDTFLAAGGIIGFVLDQNKVRFDVNIAAAERSGLKLSSRLLRLARTVHTAQPIQGRMP